MRVLIENMENRKYMNALSEWGPKHEAYDFRTPAFAIDICVMRSLRKVRIVLDTGDPKNDVSLVVHGAERAALQKAMSKNKELRELQTALTAELDQERAEKKELKKQVPFERKTITSDQESDIRRQFRLGEDNG